MIYHVRKIAWSQNGKEQTKTKQNKNTKKGERNTTWLKHNASQFVLNLIAETLGLHNFMRDILEFNLFYTQCKNKQQYQQKEILTVIINLRTSGVPNKFSVYDIGSAATTTTKTTTTKRKRETQNRTFAFENSAILAQVHDKIYYFFFFFFFRYQILNGCFDTCRYMALVLRELHCVRLSLFGRSLVQLILLLW